MGRLWPFAVIVAAALVIWAPTLLVDQPGHSFGYDLEWSRQFSRLVLAGDPYPRWMPRSFDGLGSPAFYFYPPLSFYVVAAVSAVTDGHVSALLQLKLAALVLLALSGWTMNLWLGAMLTPAKAVVGAVIFMAAPYHFDDHYIRGDLAEFACIAFLPLVALGLKRTADGARGGMLVLAGAYACLILAHLPLALLASIMLVAPYAIFLVFQASAGKLQLALRLAAALAVGGGLTAIYLVPALGLQGAISADYWWSANFHPSDGVLLNRDAWGTTFLLLIGAAAVVEGVAALAVVAWLRGRDRTVLFWAALTVGVFALVAGVLPGFWALPLVSKVQFPWRAIALEEFALVTALALSPVLAPRRLALAGALLLLVNPAVLLGVRLLVPPAPAAPAAQPVLAYTPEYLPAGMLRIDRGEPAPRVGFDQLQRLPLVAGAASATADEVTGAIRLRPGVAGQPLIARAFYFPSWQARCDGKALPVGPVGPARLVGFTPPAGAADCRLFVAATSQEQLGAILSGLSLALWLAYAIWAFAVRSASACQTRAAA
jgi:hypothetical protein